MTSALVVFTDRTHALIAADRTRHLLSRASGRLLYSSSPLRISLLNFAISLNVGAASLVTG